MSRFFIAAPILAIAVIAAGVATWWFVIRSDASPLEDPRAIPSSLLSTATPTPAITEPGATTSAASPTTGATAGQTWTIVSGESEADYYVGETLASIGVPSTANGKTTDITGTFHLNADGTALDTSQTSEFIVDVTTLQSDEDRRDNRVQQALETSQFPTATFTVSSITGLDTNSIVDGQTVEFEMSGTLELHGVSKEVTWSVEAKREQNVISAIADLEFLFADYNINPPDIGGFVSVDDGGTLQAVIIAQLQS